MKPVAKYCGPAAVASVLGISREEAAHRLLEIEPQRRGWFHSKTVAKVLGRRRGPHVPKSSRPSARQISATSSESVATTARSSTDMPSMRRQTHSMRGLPRRG